MWTHGPRPPPPPPPVENAARRETYIQTCNALPSPLPARPFTILPRCIIPWSRLPGGCLSVQTRPPQTADLHISTREETEPSPAAGDGWWQGKEGNVDGECKGLTDSIVEEKLRNSEGNRQEGRGGEGEIRRERIWWRMTRREWQKCELEEKRKNLQGGIIRSKWRGWRTAMK